MLLVLLLVYPFFLGVLHKNNMDRDFKEQHGLHGTIIGALAAIVLYPLQEKASDAITIGMFVGGVSAVYMTVFGHPSFLGE